MSMKYKITPLCLGHIQRPKTNMIYQCGDSAIQDFPLIAFYLENDELAAALETVKSSWEALGFSVTLTAQDAETFKLSRNSLQYADILCSVWEADAQDQQLYLEPYLSYNVQSGCGYTNPDFDQLMLDAMQASGEERTAKLSEAETTLLEDGYVMPLYQQTITTTSDTAKVSGWSILPNGMYWFGEASVNK